MSNKVCELEDQIQDIEKEIAKSVKKRESIEAEISDIKVEIEQLNLEKEKLEDKYSEELSKFEPTLSAQERG